MFPSEWVPRTSELWAGVSSPVHLGIGLAVAGNLLIACSLALQKWVHTQLESGDEERAALGSRYFWMAVLGLMAGEMGNFAAFGLASPTVVSPLGAVAVIANALIAFLVLRERFFLRNALGLLLTVIGSVVVVINAPPTVDELSVETFAELITAPPSMVYFAVVSSSIALLMVAEPLLGHKYLLVNVMLCSLLGSITVLASSAISHFISRINSHPEVLVSPIPYIILPILISTAVLQLKHLNMAQKHFDSNQVVPVYYITFTICSISGGGIVYQDFWGFKVETALGFILGCALCFGGVYLITKRGPVGKSRAHKYQTSDSQPDVYTNGVDASAAPAPPVPPITGLRELRKSDDAGGGDREDESVRARWGRFFTPNRAALFGDPEQVVAPGADELASAIAISAQRHAGGHSAIGPRSLTEDGGTTLAQSNTAGVLGGHAGVLGRGLMVDPLGDPMLGEYLCMSGADSARVAREPSGAAARGRGHRRTVSYDHPSLLRTRGYSTAHDTPRIGWGPSAAGARLSRIISEALDHEIIVGDDHARIGIADAQLADGHGGQATARGVPPSPLIAPASPLQLSQLSHLMPGASASQLDLSPIIRPLSASRRDRWGGSSIRRPGTRRSFTVDRIPFPRLLLEEQGEGGETQPDIEGGARRPAAEAAGETAGHDAHRQCRSVAEML